MLERIVNLKIPIEMALIGLKMYQDIWEMKFKQVADLNRIFEILKTNSLKNVARK